jgi:hypothetical protein
VVAVRIHRPDDGDIPDRAVSEPAPRAADPPGDGSPLRQQRSRDYRAGAGAIYDAHAAASRPADHGRARAIDEGCARVERIERETLTPAMRRIEAEDPGRRLAGLDNRRKERYRIEEKVRHDIEKRGVTAADAFATLKDAIRYTYCYPEEQYVNSVQADAERLKSAGFELVDSRNWWSHDEYKGFNSWWRAPENEQMFEVQFHTQASLDAKEETHTAYKRLRMLPPDHAEVRLLHAYQREVTAKVPVPPGALDLSIS